MIVLYIILLHILIIFIIDYIQGFKFWLSAALDNNGIDAEIKCLYPLLKILVETREDIPFMNVYLFKKKFYEARLFKKGVSKKRAIDVRRLLKAVSVKNINISTSYGFEDPFTTGIVYGAVNIAAPFLNVERIELTPDFTSNEIYFDVNAHANFYLGQTIVNYFKNK